MTTRFPETPAELATLERVTAYLGRLLKQDNAVTEVHINENGRWTIILDDSSNELHLDVDPSDLDEED